MSRRPTRCEQACADFRKLLTAGFYVVDDDGEVDTPDQMDAALTATKLWRAEVWKAWRRFEDQLCPFQKFERTGIP